MEKTKAAAIVKRIVTSLILAPVVLWATPGFGLHL